MTEITPKACKMLSKMLFLSTIVMYMLYFAGDSMLIMRSHGVSTAVKPDAAGDI